MPPNETSAVVTPMDAQQVPGAQWQPSVGDEARGVVGRTGLPARVGDAVIDAAASILARGVDPSSGESQRSGLVVGYVQSGKTLSFTTVMALARDNGYRLVITIAGTSKNLLDQSTQRLRRDLDVGGAEGFFRWVTFTNPTHDENSRRSIQQALEEWSDPNVPHDQRPTVLVTVMKHHVHLQNLISLLGQLELEGVPTLIVDDEADQASLNTLVNRGRESTTYRRILELRDAVPCHTFLQYTATPQAPLLINIIDALSPQFVEVLEPGDSYVGGSSFFGGRRGLVRVIPFAEVPSDDNPLVDPPPTLLEALRIFLVGVAAGLIQGAYRDSKRSMMVHPSRETAQHQEYRIWIGQIFDEWGRLLNLPEDDPDRIDFMEDFREAHTDVASTVPDIPAFEDITRTLPRAFRLTSIEEVNAARRGGTPTIDWSRAYGWILVGGQAMDRGFTVEGLTVTYMPRGPGVGNADTIQQRGRFFGYKRPYLGFCRVYLEQDVLTSFEQYVDHEEEMRRQLQGVRDSGSSLTAWKRAFVLSPDLRPCRNNVVQYDYARGRYADSWFTPQFILNAQSVVDANREVAQSYLQTLTLEPDEGNPNREPAQMHHVVRDVRLTDAIEQLFVPYRFTAPRDTREITGVLLQLSHALEENADELCTIYRMSPDYLRERSFAPSGRISSTLFQGAAPVNPPELRGSVYPGDSFIRDVDRVTIQIYFLEALQSKQVVAHEVPVIAIWIPSRMELDWLAQDQP